MIKNYVDFPKAGDNLRKVSLEDLCIQKSIDFAQSLLSQNTNWVEFASCHQHTILDNGNEQVIAETVIFDTEIELPQICKNEIERNERIAVTFQFNDKNYPKVFALREDFPRVPHLNLENFEFPRSLCIFEESYDEIKLRWTSINFIERIRKWLSDTAKGILHRPDQDLEPFLIGTNTPLILPSKVLSNQNLDALPKLKIACYPWTDKNICFVAYEENGRFNHTQQNSQPFVLFTINGSPQLHGQIRQAPENIKELNEFLENAAINLKEVLRQEFKNLDSNQDLLDSGLIVMVILPKTRAEDTQPETNEIRAFVCIEKGAKFLNIKEIGEKLGFWAVTNGVLGTLLPNNEETKDEEVKLLMLNPCSTLTRQNASVFSGNETRIKQKITAVGLGALGSQVFLNMVRAGDGEWILIDKDILLPHNFVRHAAYGATAGYEKSQLLSILANDTIETPNISKSIVADILNVGKRQDEVNKILLDSEVILDCSASVAVARHLASDIESKARRISLFLSPSGEDLILLAEDSERNIPLDLLEMQYYRLIINDEKLKDHLLPPKGQIRYSTSCRDVSSQLSPDSVALCSAIGSHSLRQTLTNENAVISIWSSDGQMQVQKFDVAPNPCIDTNVKEWAIRTDEFLINKLKSQRIEHLPVETGGVLIGAYDMQRKIIYVVDSILPPKDSIESPKSFIRGSFGLSSSIKKIEEITLNNLQYLGEWHSHPQGYSANPSEDDKTLIQTLGTKLDQDGKPALVLIIGDNNYTWHIT